MAARLLFLILTAANLHLWRALSKFQTEPGYFPDILCAMLEIALLFELGELTSLSPSERTFGRGLFTRLAQWIGALAAFVLVLSVVKTPWFLIHRVDYLSDPQSVREDLLSRRSYVIDSVTSPHFSENSMPFFMGTVMKKEWMIGTLSMSAAAAANIAFRYPETRQSALTSIEAMIERMLKRDVRDFETLWWGSDPIDSLNSDNGSIGYLGHLDFMIGAHRILGGGAKYAELHDRITAALVRRIEKRPFPYLETFPGQIFTADNAVVAAALAVYDRATKSDHSSLMKRWLDYTASNLIDPASGGIVFYTTADGKPFGENRGSAAGWFSFYLPFVERAFAHSQFEKLKQALAVQVLPDDWWGGFRAVREYLPGRTGPADVDSGPIVFGLSTSGSGFAVAGATVWNDVPLRQGLMNTAEFVGTSFEWKGRKSYLLAPLIGDAIMLAMSTAVEWDDRYLQ